MNYFIGPTGRVKASAVDMDLMLQPAEALDFETYQHFGDMREAFARDVEQHVPLLVQERGITHAARIAKRTAFTRGLKDDQGPFGTHAAFQYQPGLGQESVALAAPQHFEISGAKATTTDRVGSREDTFLINPTTSPNAVVRADVQPLVSERLGYVGRLASITNELVRQGVPFLEAAEQARGSQETSAEEISMPLYAQPDVRIQADGTMHIFDLNVPDVGMFYSELDTQDNDSADSVRSAVVQVMGDVAVGLEKHVGDAKRVTLVTRDSVLQGADVLEQKEISALDKLLGSMGVGEVSTLGQSDVRGIDSDTTLVLLNTDIAHPSFAVFAEKIIRGGLRCFPNPAVQIHMREASTYETAQLSGKHLDKLYELLNPNKQISAKNCEQVHSYIVKRLEQGGVHEELFYVYIPGQASPLACTRSDLRSLFEIRKQIDKQRGAGCPVEAISIMNMPYSQEHALVTGPRGVGRVASFRCVAIGGTS